VHGDYVRRRHHRHRPSSAGRSKLLGGEVVHFVPDRMKDGYGLNAPAIDAAAREGARVVVSVDCGHPRPPRPRAGRRTWVSI